MRKRNRRPQVDQARRHFLGLAGAAGASIVAMGSLIAAALPSKAEAGGRAWWKPGHPGHGNAYGRGDSHGGTKCLLRGTAIATPEGDVRIEDLRIGDLVETVSGEALPIKWIGHHVYRRTAPTWSKQVTPIRIARFALDDHTPRHDLYLTAGHAVFIDGMLIRARDLLNGTSITRIRPAHQNTIEYFHIVLDSHQVILA
ncbi:MAG TPA: Hint domain-containing protein, partial [Sphingomonadales bacterium]|nr:Hint domain-containing protein [Sphingomonadales bacterium]